MRRPQELGDARGGEAGENAFDGEFLGDKWEGGEGDEEAEGKVGVNGFVFR